MSENDFRTYLFTYRHDGSEWVFEVKATSPADAKVRVSKMAYAVYDGELFMKMPAECGRLVKAITTVRNLLRFGF